MGVDIPFSIFHSHWKMKITVCTRTEAATFFRDIDRRITVAAGEPRSTQFLFQRLSIAIQRGNAASVVGALRLLTDALTMCFICDVLCPVLHFVNI